MCDLKLPESSTHFLKTPVEKKIDQSECKMPENQGINAAKDLTSASNEKNILHPTTVDQLLEELCKDLEAKNAANVVAALAGCPFNPRSNRVVEQ